MCRDVASSKAAEKAGIDMSADPRAARRTLFQLYFHYGWRRGYAAGDERYAHHQAAQCRSWWMNPAIMLCGADLVVCDGNLVRQDHRAAVSDLRQAAVSGSRFHGMGAGTQARISAALTRLSPTAWSWKCSATARWIRLKTSKWLATSSEARACGACSFRLAKTACIYKGPEGGIWGQ